MIIAFPVMASKLSAWIVFNSFMALASVHAEDPKAEAVMACLNSKRCGLGRTTWDHMLEDRPSCLKAHRVWWATEPSKARRSTFPVTLVTQLSSNRLPQLRAQCATWAGPIAAAIYMPLLLEEGSGGGGGGKEAGSGDGEQLPREVEAKVNEAISEIEELLKWSANTGASAGAAGGGSTAAGRAGVEPRRRVKGGDGGGGDGESSEAESSPSCSLRIVLVLEAFQQERAAAVLYPVSPPASAILDPSAYLSPSALHMALITSLSHLG